MSERALKQNKYTGKQVIRAGEKLIKAESLNDKEFHDAFDVLSYWRFSHEQSLESALQLLRSTTLDIDKNAIFAKRLKRYVSIVEKLKRFPSMKLKNMQDIGGGRAIVSNTKKLTKIVRELRKKPAFKNQNNKVRFKDYIKKPKDDGYRGFHLVGQFQSAYGIRNIELQIRTKLQHDWATSLEIVDLFTGQALKSNQGQKNWSRFFLSVSQQFAVMEDIHIFDTLSERQKLRLYQEKLKEYAKEDVSLLESCFIAREQAKKLKIVQKLKAYSSSLKIVDEDLEDKFIDGYVLLEIDLANTTVISTMITKDNNIMAESLYSQAEQKAANIDDWVVALVSTSALGGIKEAYPNYFADSSNFLDHLYLILNARIEENKGFFYRLFN